MRWRPQGPQICGKWQVSGEVSGSGTGVEAYRENAIGCALIVALEGAGRVSEALGGNCLRVWGRQRRLLGRYLPCLPCQA